ncbi:DUF2066 domain-containing protein [Candidatus Photodesmus anomalopis]|nr:DUF2066 domain-containing protein [Candidatus Photodesmus katoptron]
MNMYLQKNQKKQSNRNILSLTVPIFLLMMNLPIHAVTKVNLYYTEIIAKKNQESLDEHRIIGMKEVIVRSSGDKKVLDNEIIQNAINNKASQYLTHISYSKKNKHQSIQMYFSGEHIRSLFRQAKIPFWQENRENLLLWLVEKSDHTYKISWESSETLLSTSIKNNAKKRGLPLIFPIGDFKDINNITVSDLWGGILKPLSVASQRYQTDTVLVVINNNKNNLNWILYDQKASSISNSNTKIPITGKNSGAFAYKEMIDQLSNYYANKNSLTLTNKLSETIKIRFTKMKNPSDIFQIEQQLKNLNSVAFVDILEIQGASAIFNIHLLSSKENFEKELSNIELITKFI